MLPSVDSGQKSFWCASVLVGGDSSLQALREKGNHGYCSICEHPVYFEIEGPWLRDQYRCVNCKSIPRWRALMSVVAELYPKWRELKIHESSPGGPLSDKLARECPEYLPSQFFPV